MSAVTFSTMHCCRLEGGPCQGMGIRKVSVPGFNPDSIIRFWQVACHRNMTF